MGVEVNGNGSYRDQLLLLLFIGNDINVEYCQRYSLDV